MTPYPLALRWASIAEISPPELYRLLQLRVEVFVVEQHCPYPELDGRDTEPGTVHLWHELGGGAGGGLGGGTGGGLGDGAGPAVVSTLRVLDDGASRAIGRVATAAGFRGRGLAAQLMDAGIALCGELPVTLGAQAHLEGWYQRFGFARSGPGYVEDGIAHVPMRREPA